MYNQQMMGQMGQMGQMGMGMQQMPMGQPMMQPMAPMHSPWVMYYNQQGQPYYYNEQTGALSGFALDMIRYDRGLGLLCCASVFSLR